MHKKNAGPVDQVGTSLVVLHNEEKQSVAGFTTSIHHDN